MPGTSLIDDIELIIEDIRGGGGKPPSRRDDGDGGDDSGNTGGDRKPEPGRSSPKKYSTAIFLAMLSILMFLTGQVIAWRHLAAEGVYMASRLSSSFFYVFTALHAAHLLGGICALLYVGLRNFEAAHVSRFVAAEVTSYYWHFMDGLWLFLLALLYFGQ